MSVKGKSIAPVLGRFFARICAAWFLGIALTLILRPGDASYTEYSLENLRLTLICAGAALALFTGGNAVFRLKKRQNFDLLALLGSSVLLSAVSAYKFMSIFYSVGCFVGLCAVCAVCFYRCRLTLPELTLGKKASLLILLASGAAVSIFVAAVSIVRYRAYYAPTFDFGIFANMFENMLSTGLPNTTCERNGLLSHFAVHLSPIFYLILPVYALFPRPETLLIVQAAAVASGCVPMWLIARKKTGNSGAAAVFALLYLLYPAFSCGAFFDFHENKFLAPLILWLLWFAEEKKRLPMYLFFLLTLAVKEDAPVYTAVIGLYLFFGKKERLHGGIMFLGSGAYFALALGLLSRFGEGAQLWRYDNIAPGGIREVIKATLLNPMRVIASCVDGDKIKFIFQMLFPLLGLPLMCRKPSGCFLLIPFLLVNLMPSYAYQHDIGYQYTYGSGALLVYLSVVNWCDVRKALKPRYVSVCALGVCAAALLSFMSSGARGGMYFKMAREEAHLISSIDYALDSIPEEKSVCASTMFVAHLADREEIYDLDDEFRLADYVAIDLRNRSTQEADTQIMSLEALGYRQKVICPGAAVILEKY